MMRAFLGVGISWWAMVMASESLETWSAPLATALVLLAAATLGFALVGEDDSDDDDDDDGGTPEAA